MTNAPEDIRGLHRRIAAAVNRSRLLDAARELVAVPSPTGAAGAAADRLAKLIAADARHEPRGDPSRRPRRGG